MAQLKQLVVNGATRLIGTLYATLIQTNKVNAPTTAGGTTYGTGTNGQVLKTNGTTVYWGNDDNTTYESKTAASGGSDVSLVTTGEKYTWNNKGTYSKPSGGIPKTDLASAVQTSLGKADSALQSHQTIKQDGITGATVNRYCTCNTLANVAAKTVSITNGTFALETGARVTVYFTDTNTAASPTLNVANTGAKSIMYNQVEISNSIYTALLGGCVDLVYDGYAWNIVGLDVSDCYGVCSDNASTVAKTVTITKGAFSLYTGARITVKFTNGNTATGAVTLNVNSTGAKHISFADGANIQDYYCNYLLEGFVDFVYDGYCWQLLHKPIAADGVRAIGATDYICHYATCNTAANSAFKEASLYSGALIHPTTLQKGTRLSVEFVNKNTAGGPMLRILHGFGNNRTTDYASIRYKGNSIDDNVGILYGVVDLVYDGNCWQLIGDYDDISVTNTLGTTTKYYVTGTTTATTNTGTQIFDTGIYSTTTAGQLNATTYKVNEAVTMQYNSTTESLDFIFA